MLLLTHVGFTVGGGMVVERMRRLPPLNYPALAFMSISADIVDRGLYLFVLPDAQAGRLIAHTLAFQVVQFVVLVAIRRDWWIYGVASLLHLALDSAALPVDHAFWPLWGASLDHISIIDGSAVPGQPFLERVQERIDHELVPYKEASVKDLRLELAGLALVLAYLLGDLLVRLWQFRLRERQGARRFH